jgi:superfamily II DNA/RNA helicase
MTPYDPAAPGQSFLNRSFFHRSSQSVPDRMNFSELGLSDELLRAVIDAGYTTPTPIQREAIPHVLRGRDVLGCAQTGTGKTASFTLPMIEVLAA